MDEYDDLYNQSYGDLNPDTGDFGDGNDMFAELQKSILGNEDDSGSMSSYSPAGKSQSASVYDPVPNGLDPKITKIVRAIREVESGGNYNAKGKSGEFGAYQFMPSSWKQWAGEFLGDQNAPMSKENQNQVAYKKIESLAKAGHSPDQIVSIWNSGQPKYEGKVGVNKYGVAYDVPAYVRKVMSIATMPTPAYAEAPQVDPTTQMPVAPVSQETPTPETPEKKSIGGFIGNLEHSALDFGKGLANIVVHPVDTVKNIGKLALGAGDLLGSTVGLTDGQGQNADMARGLGNMYAERYGGLDNVGNTLYKDPIGVAADLATLLSGGAGAASKLGMVGKLGEAGKLGELSSVASKLAGANDIASGLSKVAKVSDPLTYIAKGKNYVTGSKVGQWTKDIPAGGLGFTSGIGKTPLKEIYRSGKEGSNVAVNAMRGGVSESEIVSDVQSLLKGLKNDRSGAFTSSLEKLQDEMFTTQKGQLYVKKFDKELGKELFVPTNVTTKGIKDIATKQLKSIGANAKGRNIDFSEVPSLDSKGIQKVHDTIYNWENVTPLGLNKLKQEIRGFRKGGINLSPADSRFNIYVDSITKNIADYVGEKVPQIKKLNEDYAIASKPIKDLTSEFSLKGKDSTVMTKLMTGYNKSDTARSALLEQMRKQGKTDLPAKIAGFRAKELIPETAYSKLIGGGIGGAAFFNPSTLFSLPAFSPKLVGETANFLGKIVGKTQRGTSTVGKTKAGSAIKYLGGQVYDKSKATRTSTLIERMKGGQNQSQE